MRKYLASNGLLCLCDIFYTGACIYGACCLDPSNLGNESTFFAGFELKMINTLLWTIVLITEL